MRSYFVRASAIALLAGGLAAGSAQASTFLYNTGFDAQGHLIPLGTEAVDGNWQLTGGDGTGVPSALPAATYASAQNGQFPIGYWVPDSTTSRWITPTPNAAASFDPSLNGTYEFTQQFVLTAAQAGDVSFTGQFAADNLVEEVSLNGHILYSASDSGLPSNFGGWTSFGDVSHIGFMSGTNTLTFVVENYAQNGGNPAGLNVQFLSEAVPEPGTWAFLLLGLGMLGFALRRRPAVAFAI